MREAELRRHAKCNLCGQPMLHTGVPLFWRLTVERFGVRMDAVKRQDGLATFLGNSNLAAIMGPDEQMAEPVMETVHLAICEECMVTRAGFIMQAAFDAAEVPGE